jgi:hypothetical protein
MNGQVLTSKMEGCPSDADLCDVQVLLNRVTPFATADRDCESHHRRHPAIEESKVLLSSTGGVLLVLFVTVASGLLGSLCTFCYLTRRLPCRKGRSSYELGMASVPSNNEMSSYHDDVDGFSDEPGDVDAGNGVQIKTASALVE